jgi:hypothetical protein
MTPKLARALELLREDLPLQKVAAGVLSGPANVVRAIDRMGVAGQKHLLGAGHPTLATIARFAPHAVAGAGIHRVYKSDPVQNLIYRYQLWKARRAQQGGYQ